MYKPYHRSPKNVRELAEHAQQLEVNLLKIGRVLDVRRAASSFRTVKAVWNSNKALYHHFSAASVDVTRDENDKAMYRGLMEQEDFLCDLALMYDTFKGDLPPLSKLARKRNDPHKSRHINKMNNSHCFLNDYLSR